MDGWIDGDPKLSEGLLLRTITTYPLPSPALPTRWFSGLKTRLVGYGKFVPWRVWLQNPKRFNELRVESFDAHAAPEEFQSWTPGQGAFGGLGVRQDGKNTRRPVFWREKWLWYVCFTWKTNEFPDEYEVCFKKNACFTWSGLIKTKSSCPSLGIFFVTFHNGHSPRSNATSDQEWKACWFSLWRRLYSPQLYQE